MANRKFTVFARRCCLYAMVLLAFVASTEPEVVSESTADSTHGRAENAAPLVNSSGTGHSSRLTNHLMSGHNKDAPPDGIVFVHYELELVHILGIDELKQTLTALVYIDERWKDTSLAWNPTEFGGINKTWLPLGAVWVPDVIVINLLEHDDVLSSVRAPVTVYSDGTVESSRPQVYTVMCEINIENFPLDEQHCSLEIASWAYSADKIHLTAHLEHSLDHYAPNEEWHLINVSVAEAEYTHEGVQSSEITFEITVRRKPLFYMMTVTFPSYVMCAISIVGLFARFTTSNERQERFSLGITSILTSAVLSLVVAEKVPHSSTAVPLLVAYFLFNMVLISVAAITTGFVMWVHRLGRHGDEPPNWLLRVFLLAPKDREKNKPFDHESVGLKSSSNHHNLDSNENECNGGIPEWPKVLTGRPASGLDAATYWRICSLEASVKRLCDIWHSLRAEMDLGTADYHRTQQLRRESNGYVRIARRIDIILELFFLTILTIPVVYLFMYTFRAAGD